MDQQPSKDSQDFKQWYEYGKSHGFLEYLAPQQTAAIKPKKPADEYLEHIREIKITHTKKGICGNILAIGFGLTLHSVLMFLIGLAILIGGLFFAAKALEGLKKANDFESVKRTSNTNPNTTPSTAPANQKAPHPPRATQPRPSR
jgi:hypothetical protein